MAVVGALVAGGALYAGSPAVADEAGTAIEPVEIALTDSSASLTADAREGAADADEADLATGTTIDGSAVITDQIDRGQFTVSALTWNSEDSLEDENAAFIRVLEASGWSDWSSVSADPQQSGNAGGSDPFISGVATAVQVQITGEADSLPADLKLVVAEQGDGSLSSRVGPQANTQSGTTDEGREGIARGIRPRSAWDGNSPAPTWGDEQAKLKAAIVHHTAGTNNYAQGDVPGIIAGIYYYHAITLGWGDIGYNFLVDKYGGMWEGREGSLDVAASSMIVGGHAYSSNTGTLGVSALGTYTSTAPTQAMLNAFKTVIEYRFDLAGLDARDASGFTSQGGAALARIFGHRDVYPTDCPGNQIYSQLSSLVQQVGAPSDWSGSWEQKNGNWYYRYSDGSLATGWLSTGGSWYYLRSDGVMLTGWVNDRGTWYYLDASGAMASGWVKLGSSWYYLASSGAMTTGWLSTGGSWYYLRSDGSMATGWNSIGGKWYHLDANGVLRIGWVQVGSPWYYTDGGGAMLTGWQKVGATWYYLAPDGAMATGWQKLGGTWYYLDASGAMRTGWLQLGNTWYYLRSDGSMATGWVSVGGTWYYLDASGAWVQ